MTSATEWDEDRLVKVSEVVRRLDFSRPLVYRLFDAEVLPGVRVGRERRIYRGFMADLFAEIRFGAGVVVLEDFARDWKAAQAGRSAA